MAKTAFATQRYDGVPGQPQNTHAKFPQMKSSQWQEYKNYINPRAESLRFQLANQIEHVSSKMVRNLEITKLPISAF